MVCGPDDLSGEDLAGAPVVHEGSGEAKMWGTVGSSSVCGLEHGGGILCVSQ